LILAAFAPPLTELAFKFGPAEYFSLMILGLIGAVVLASGSLLKAIAMIVLGLLMGLVGTDVNSGVARYSFDIPELTDGIGFVAIAMGVFGYGEIIANLSQPDEDREVFTAKVTGLFPTKEDFRNMVPAILRGTALGSALGILPGAGLVRGLHHREEDQVAPGRSAFRQGQHPWRGRTRIGQQRRCANVVHPALDARHSAQRGDGVDGRRHDHPQHPAGSAGHDQQP
jgi:putative tricarboxylic transport membrane protein